MLSESVCQEINSIIESIGSLPFDSLSIGVIDFENSKCQLAYHSSEYELFDLASLTKPLTCSVIKLIHPEIFNENLNLLLNHEGGLIPWSRLSKSSWKKYLESKDVKKSDSCYSDLSFLKLMIEIEKKIGPIKNALQPHMDELLYFWKDLEEKSICAPTGMRQKKIIQGEVHDDNAFVINEFTCHAGLFSSVIQLGNYLININKKFDLLKIMKDQTCKKHNRFVEGWDTPSKSGSLAGEGFSSSTFGHLGFTGTSVWLDPEKKLGQIILSNCTQNYWQERTQLNLIRKRVGTLLWSQ